MGYRTFWVPVVRRWRESRTGMPGRGRRRSGPDLSALGGSGSESVVVEVKFRAEATGDHALACLQRLPVQPGSALAFTAREALAGRMSAWHVVIGPLRPLHFRSRR